MLILISLNNDLSDIKEKVKAIYEIEDQDELELIDKYIKKIKEEDNENNTTFNFEICYINESNITYKHVNSKNLIIVCIYVMI